MYVAPNEDLNLLLLVKLTCNYITRCPNDLHIYKPCIIFCLIGHMNK